MIVEVKVPVFAESIQEGTLLEWQKQPGETVGRGEHLVDIETDKVVLEVAAPEAGVLRDLLRPAGETVTSEELIATIDTAASAREAQARPAAEPAEPALSPAVRRLAAEHGLDAREVPGSGKGGRVTRPDVLAYLEGRQAGEAATGSPPAAPSPPPPSAPAPGARPGRQERREKVSRIRARIAERLVEAQHRAALLTTFNEVDMAPVMALRRRYRDRFQEAHGVRLGLMSFFARAAVAALQRFPVVNARLEGEEVVYHDYYDVGIAVASPRGLVVPILRDVDRLSFADIERAIADFADRARDGRLTPGELASGTFTITNGGVFGSLLSTPIVNPPQSAILGMHKIQDRPVAEDGQVVVRPMMYLALTYDHRLVDGREAVQFLVTVKETIEDPARLLLGV